MSLPPTVAPRGAAPVRFRRVDPAAPVVGEWMSLSDFERDPNFAFVLDLFAEEIAASPRQGVEEFKATFPVESAGAAFSLVASPFVPTGSARSAGRELSLCWDSLPSGSPEKDRISLESTFVFGTCYLWPWNKGVALVRKGDSTFWLLEPAPSAEPFQRLWMNKNAPALSKCGQRLKVNTFRLPPNVQDLVFDHCRPGSIVVLLNKTGSFELARLEEPPGKAHGANGDIELVVTISARCPEWSRSPDGIKRYSTLAVGPSGMIFATTTRGFAVFAPDLKKIQEFSIEQHSYARAKLGSAGGKIFVESGKFSRDNGEIIWKTFAVDDPACD